MLCAARLIWLAVQGHHFLFVHLGCPTWSSPNITDHPPQLARCQAEALLWSSVRERGS